ncbi:choice-of-anchor G family protein [Pseudolysinimonas sp.]|uniref:choice-of-anchor G family protein n=1 Tax=Pseudolysinimonas sp. TaxID=2680009 RepID=UPI00286CF0F0|nr:choice-of-anchor G family protein [Pseudolysinimonas sp.]
MFTTAHPRVATPLGGSAARNNHGTAKRIVATVTAFVLGGAFALAAPLATSADELPESYAKGQFLSGTVAGFDLDQIVSLGAAEASNDGTQATQVEKDPLDADVLDGSYVIEEAESPQVELDGVQIGPAAQYAEANDDGTSLGASGAIADDGAIGFGDHQSTPPANATLDLQVLLGNEFASTLADLKLELGALSALARADLDTASGDYQIADAVLTFSSPAIADLTPKVDSALEEVVDAIGELIGGNGALVNDVNGLLIQVDPALNLLGGNADVSVTIDAGNLEDVVHEILKKEYGNGAVSFDLETGEVHVDLEALLGGDLNDLAPGTELLSDTVVNQILEGIATTVATIADQVVEEVDEALHDATVDIHADLSTNVAQAPIAREVCQLVNRVLTTPVLRNATSLELITNGLLGDVSTLLNTGAIGSLTDSLADDIGDFVLVNGVIQRITGFVNQTVQDNVCNPTSTPVAPLTTSVVLDIEATVDELLYGTAATAVADVDILGIDTDLDLDVLLGDLGGSLLDGLFDGDGAVQDLVDALETNLVHPATDALLGSGVGTVGEALRDALSVKANVQELTSTGGGGEFTETAIRVSAFGEELATLNLAQATVGPNVTTVVDPDCTDPGGCDTGGETVTSPDGGGLSGGGLGGSLAYTGIGIATLIAVILALLAAGTYLVRESYRRNHPVVTTIR